MTLFFRLLSQYKKGTPEQGVSLIKDAFYHPNEIQGERLQQWETWFKAYDSKLQNETLTDVERQTKMNAVNPKYVLRNYMAQLAIDKADGGDFSLVEELFQVLKSPYEEQPQNEQWFAKRPDWARHKVGCSMLSCSS